MGEGEQSKRIRVAVYYPLGDRQDCSLERTRAAVEDYLCEIFGGVTSYPATGVYRTTEGRTLRESVQVLESYATTEMWVEHETAVKCLSAALARQFKQESVAVSVGGVLVLVSPRELESNPGGLATMPLALRRLVGLAE